MKYRTEYSVQPTGKTQFEINKLGYLIFWPRSCITIYYPRSTFVVYHFELACSTKWNVISLKPGDVRRFTVWLITIVHFPQGFPHPKLRWIILFCYDKSSRVAQIKASIYPTFYSLLHILFLCHILRTLKKAGWIEWTCVSGRGI